MAALRHILATSALSLCLTQPAAAQEEYESLGEIVLTALRTAAERLRTGVSVAVVGEEELRRSATVAEALAQLPGVSVASSGPFGSTTTLRVRGADGRYLAVYVDGIRVSDPTGTTVSFDFGGLLAADIGRVELLRGSQSALWGGSAVAGVISISTRAALEEGLHQAVSVEGGSYGTARLGYGLTQKDDRLELSLNLTQLHTDGWSAAPAGTEADGADASRLSFSARYNISDALAVGGALFLQRMEQDYDRYTDPDTDYVYDTIAEAGYAQARTERGARLFAEASAGATEHVVELTYYDIDRGFEEAGTPSSYGGNRLGLGWQATTTLSPALALVYGLDWSREEAEYSHLPGGVADTIVAGAFAQAIWSPSEAFDLSATVRTDRNSAFGSFPTGRLALAWRPAEATTLHAAFATGFRAPSIDERFGDYPEYWFTGNPDLEPEESRSWEMGVEQALAGGGSLGVTLFRLEIDNLIQLVPPFYDTLENLPGESVRQGAEVALALPLGERADLALSYTYTDARRPSGVRLVQVPFHMIALSLDGQVSDRLSAGLSLRHAAGRIDNDVETFALEARPDYTVLDARLGYDLSDSAAAYLRIENLTDEEYQLVDGYAASGRAVYVGLEAKF